MQVDFKQVVIRKFKKQVKTTQLIYLQVFIRKNKKIYFGEK